MNEEWVEEEISLRKSILFKRVYRNEKVLLKHVKNVTKGKNGVVIVFKFKRSFPSPNDVVDLLNIIKVVKNENTRIKSIRIIRLLYGGWFLEIAVYLVGGVISGVLGSIIANVIWEKIKRNRNISSEELTETEEYYPNGNVKRKTRRYRKY